MLVERDAQTGSHTQLSFLSLSLANSNKWLIQINALTDENDHNLHGGRIILSYRLQPFKNSAEFMWPLLHLMFINFHNWCFFFCLVKWPSLDESVSLFVYWPLHAIMKYSIVFLLAIHCGKNKEKRFWVRALNLTVQVRSDDLGYGLQFNLLTCTRTPAHWTLFVCTCHCFQIDKMKWEKLILTNYISFWRSKPQASTIDRCFSIESL